MARRVAVDLTPKAVEQVAVRVTQLLQRQHQQEQRRASEPTGMLTVAEIAKHLHLNRAWVYEHADELGAIRVGNGPKARIRFDLPTALKALERHAAEQGTAAGLQLFRGGSVFAGGRQTAECLGLSARTSTSASPDASATDTHQQDQWEDR